jgi:hypothetical protein
MPINADLRFISEDKRVELFRLLYSRLVATLKRVKRHIKAAYSVSPADISIHIREHSEPALDNLLLFDAWVKHDRAHVFRFQKVKRDWEWHVMNIDRLPFLLQNRN